MFALLATLLAAPALAAPVDEDIIVYDDDFARWDHTRWLVKSDLLLPISSLFARDASEQFLSNMFQIRAVVLCDKDAPLGKKKFEVNCKIEDMAILATAENQWKKPKDRERVQRVLDEVDAKLTGAAVQLQVDRTGGVPNIDLEGVAATNRRENQNRETLRQIMGRVVAGFHLKIPEHAYKTGQFVEYNSTLMAMPSETATRGSTTMVHTVSKYQNLRLVQTLGEGTISSEFPNPQENDFFEANNMRQAPDVMVGAAGQGASGLNAGAPDGVLGETYLPPINLTYALSHSGAAVFDPETGIMTERVWLTTGESTAGSEGGVFTLPFRNAGRIRMLADGEEVDLGPSSLVAYPGQELEGVRPWVDLEAPPRRLE